MRKAYLSACLFIFSAVAAQAYDYPTAGGGDALYQSLFTKIEEGRCEDLTADFEALSSAGEDINPDFYRNLCLFESGNIEDGYKGIEALIAEEDYDEAVYLLDRREQKDPVDSRVYKYRGDIGDLTGQPDEALENYKIYKRRSGDPAADYIIIDQYIKRGEYAEAKTDLEAVKVRDERYFTRRAVLGLSTGNTHASLTNMRKAAASSDPAKSAEASMLLAEMCIAAERYDCAEEAYAKALPPEELAAYKETLNRQKKRFGALIMLGEQYDTNVSSVDEDAADSFSEEESFRTYIAADLKLNFYGGIYDKTEVGILNYKSWNHSMPDYNAQLHKLYAGFTKKYDSFELLLPHLSYTYVFMDDKTYSDTFTVKFQGTYIKDTWRFYIPVEFSLKNYRGEKENYSRDGEVYKGGLGVSKSFGLRHLAKLEAHIAKDDADGKFRQLTKSELNASYTNIITDKLTLRLNADVIYYDYDENSRHDVYTGAGAALYYKFAERHFISGGYSYYKNDSNKDINDYKKHIIDLSISYLY